MKSDFLLAITQISAEKNLPKEVVVAAVEAALASAYRKDNFAINQNISVKINPTTGKVEVWAEKTVVEKPSDVRCDISLEEARQTKPEVQIGETVKVEATPSNAGRIAAQTAKQVIMQRLHEAEHSAILEEYADREGDIVSGTVQRVEPRQILIDLGRTEAMLSAAEQVRNERYRVGQRVKVYLLEVAKTGKGPQVVVSRSHPGLVRRLFELEVPEVANGIVEIKSIAREAGLRSKVAVAARQEGIDPVGCCVGLRGIRIQNIVNELHGEKIDVVTWHPDPATFIVNALSPAQILNVGLNAAEGVATVIVPDRQLSLAIGKEGQNARLAAKLSGWRIDIKSASAAAAEMVAEPETKAEAKEEAGVSEEIPAAEPVAIAEPILEPVEAVPAEVVKAAAEAGEAEEVELLPSLDTAFTPPTVTVKPEIRFAEDIMESLPTKIGAKPRKKKKKGVPTKEGEEGVKPRKSRRMPGVIMDEDEEY